MQNASEEYQTCSRQLNLWCSHAPLHSGLEVVQVVIGTISRLKYRYLPCIPTGTDILILNTGDMPFDMCSLQVSEEGEIALEDGEIEGEILEAESEAPPAEAEARHHRKPGYEDYRHEDRHRDWNQPRFPGGRGRGRGRGGRGSYGYGHDNRYAEPRPW